MATIDSMYCDRDDCPRPREPISGGIEHLFSIYGGLLRFHPECCPGEYDGTRCTGEHPYVSGGLWLKLRGPTVWTEDQDGMFVAVDGDKRRGLVRRGLYGTVKPLR